MYANADHPWELPLYTDDDLSGLRPPPFQVENVLPSGGLTVLYGAPDTFKTFAALDLALCVATGLAWHGRDVVQGATVYIAGEGAQAMGVRVGAWKRHHGIGRIGADWFRLIPQPVPLLDELMVKALIDTLDANFTPWPALIFVDTLARCAGGMADENSASDMGKLVAACDQCRDNGAGVLVIHHAGTNGRMRGSSALIGAADTIIKAERHDDRSTRGVKLICEKQKDAEPFTTLTLDKRVVALDPAQTVTSCVLVEPPTSALAFAAVTSAPSRPAPSRPAPSRPASASASASPEEPDARHQEQALRALHAAGEAGLGYTEWEKASGIGKGNFAAARAALSASGLVEKRNATDRLSPYVVTARGRERLGARPVAGGRQRGGEEGERPDGEEVA